MESKKYYTRLWNLDAKKDLCLRLLSEQGNQSSKASGGNLRVEMVGEFQSQNQAGGQGNTKLQNLGSFVK